MEHFGHYAQNKRVTKCHVCLLFYRSPLAVTEYINEKKGEQFHIRLLQWKTNWTYVYHQFLHLDSFALSFNISLHALLLDSDDDPGVYANVTSSPTKDGMYRDESFLTTLVGCTLSCRNVKDNPAVSPNRRGRLRELWIPGSKSGGARRWWVP